MIFRALAVLLLAFSTHAFAAEPKADIVYFNGNSEQNGLVEYWISQGFRVHVIDVAHADFKNPGVMLDRSAMAQKLFVAGSKQGAKLAIDFSNGYAKNVAGLILLEPEISGREVLASTVPVLMQRIDALDPLKIWVIEQMNSGRNLLDVGYFDSEELYAKLGRRMTIDFANAVLAGRLRRVVP